jgi:hypothetical protein
VTFRIELTRQAKHALTEGQPESVAAACHEFIHGALAVNPHRVLPPVQLIMPVPWSRRAASAIEPVIDG